ncbi:hypothetical protein CB1_000243038 [Camelus ferus]|nr:hypothetical protein CB1_000243038 [Camelus ferus]
MHPAAGVQPPPSSFSVTPETAGDHRNAADCGRDWRTDRRLERPSPRLRGERTLRELGVLAAQVLQKQSGRGWGCAAGDKILHHVTDEKTEASGGDFGGMRDWPKEPSRWKPVLPDIPAWVYDRALNSKVLMEGSTSRLREALDS